MTYPEGYKENSFNQLIMTLKMQREKIKKLSLLGCIC